MKLWEMLGEQLPLKWTSASQNFLNMAIFPIVVVEFTMCFE